MFASAKPHSPPMHNLGPIIGMEVYANDVVVRRSGSSPNVKEQTRGEIMEFSKASRRRLAFVASNTAVKFRTMITLTYPKQFPGDGIEVKVHLNRFLLWLQKDIGKCSYLWFLEFQQRGAPHIHMFVDYPLPRSREETRDLRFRVSTMWYRAVGSRDPKHLAAGTRTERIRKQRGAARYAVKYAQKMRQKLVPAEFRNVGRFWGASRDVKPEPIGSFACSEEEIRAELEEWEFAPSADRLVYRVLYNQADRFCHHLDP